MKKILLLLSACISLSAAGQSAIDWYNKGNEKLNASDYAGSIKDYDRALMIDNKFTDAYYNRGTSKLYLKNYRGALDDFSKAINLKPDFVNAYNNRANAKLSLNDTKGAIEDFNTVIKLDPVNSAAYLMRGQIKYNMDDRTGGCADLIKAKELGDSRADNIVKQFCVGTSGKESLKLEWPANEKWKVANDQDNPQQHLVEMIREGETLQNWTEMITFLTIKDIAGMNVDIAMNMMYEQAKGNAPQAKLTFLEKDLKAEHPWIIFLIESPKFNDDPKPESQMWYIVQGKQALYSNFRAIKKANIPADLREKWMKFFKTGKIVNE